MIRPRADRLRLDPLSYDGLRQQILRRDGWRCQSCGTMSNLEVHHQGIPQPFGSRHRGKLDHALHGMPHQSALPLRAHNARLERRQYIRAVAYLTVALRLVGGSGRPLVKRTGWGPMVAGPLTECVAPTKS